jgi:DNA-binding IclR family transcriptional regulator
MERSIMIRSVTRALAVFDAFDSDRMSLPLLEIGKRIRMPKATTFRLVNTLERAGYLVRLDNQEYCLSLKMVRLAGLVPSTMNVRDAARPVMLDINRRTGETITLNARLKSERVVIDVVDTPAPLMAIARAGEHIPLVHGAAGRILLAFVADDKRAALLKSIARSEKIDVAALTRDLDRCRRQGYALTSGQRVPGLTAISVPIHDRNNEVHHCVALSGPSVRVDGRVSEFVEIMMAAGAKISDRLGMPRSNAA